MVENAWLLLYRSAMEGRDGKQHDVYYLCFLEDYVAHLATKTNSRCTFPMTTIALFFVNPHSYYSYDLLVIVWTMQLIGSNLMQTTEVYQATFILSFFSLQCLFSSFSSDNQCMVSVAM